VNITCVEQRKPWQKHTDMEPLFRNTQLKPYYQLILYYHIRFVKVHLSVGLLTWIYFTFYSV